MSFHSSTVAPQIPQQWIVWNVGQGSWLTHVEKNRCVHLDAGGEGRIPDQVLEVCRKRSNIIAITHTDWDHISFLKKIAQTFSHICQIDTTYKKNSIPICASSPIWSWRPPMKTKTPNDSSQVFYFKNLLFPGDSPKKFEKYWMGRLPEFPKILVLAHHGSRTGTSAKLLEYYKSIQMAVASARRSKYGHPHKRVVEALRLAHVPLLSTEVWGNIHFLDKENF